MFGRCSVEHLKKETILSLSTGRSIVFLNGGSLCKTQRHIVLVSKSSILIFLKTLHSRSWQRSWESISDMRKLWLDDERQAPAQWIHVTTANEAIHLLMTGEFDEVSLDHDLGACKACTDSCTDDMPDCPHNGNGYQVLCWLESRVADDSLFRVPVIRVHTANPSARLKMLAAKKSIETILWRRLLS